MSYLEFDVGEKFRAGFEMDGGPGGIGLASYPLGAWGSPMA